MRPDLLHVIGVYFNHRRNAYLPILARQWIEHMLASGVKLLVAEHVLGERPFEFDPAEYPSVTFIQLRGTDSQELFLKEALAKAAAARLPQDAKYVCLEDMDIFHADPHWAAETVQMLQHHPVGWTWTHAIDLDRHGNVMRNEWGNDVDRSFGAAWLAGDVTAYAPAGARYRAEVAQALRDGNRAIDPRQHYGYSTAYRREVLSGIGGFLDWLITGSADYHMAMGFAGLLDKIIDPNATPGYARRLREFARRCDLHIRQDIGCVPGIIHAGYHGAKTNRHYLSRQTIIHESEFDPDVDLAHDVNGIPMLIGDNRILRGGLQRYFTIRNEER